METETRGLAASWQELTCARLWPTLPREAVPLINLENARGERTTLAALLEALFQDYPHRPEAQGGFAIERRKSFWRFALLDALKSPAVALLRDFVREGCPGTPLALNEWWGGASSAHEARRNGAFYAPRAGAKPLIDWLTLGLARESPRAVWPCGAEATLPVLYEDDSLIAVNKPAKLASVPGIKEQIDAKSLLERDHGPLHVVHRLDTDTSGVLLFAKDKETLARLSETFRQGLAFKRYRARLESTIPVERGEIDLPLANNPQESPKQCVLPIAEGGKPSRTLFEVVSTSISEGREKALVDLFPQTGRTHQLRLHCAHAAGLGVSIDGDPFYGSRGLADQIDSRRLCLHAAELTLPHPRQSTILHLESPADFDTVASSSGTRQAEPIATNRPTTFQASRFPL